MFYILVPYTNQLDVTGTDGMFPTVRQLIIYSLNRCGISDILQAMSCVLHVLQRYTNYSHQDIHIKTEHTWMTATDQICGTFLFDFSHTHTSQPQMNRMHKLQLEISSAQNYYINVRFLQMTFAYSTDCFEQGVFVVNHRSKAILSQFCGVYDTFDMIYQIKALDIEVYCIIRCSVPYLRIRYQPTYRTPSVPLTKILTSDNYRLLYERRRITNGAMFWARVAFHNMIHLMKYRTNENVTIFDGPSVDCEELTGLIASSFQILIKLLIHAVTVNISYQATAAPQHIGFSDIFVTTETRSMYRVYGIPSGFEVNHVTITGMSGEACNLGGVVLLQHQSDAGWEEIGPYCVTSFWDISALTDFMSTVVIYSYGATNVSLHMSELTGNDGQFVVHMGLRNSFVAEMDRYHFGEFIEKLSILPKPWNNGNSDTVLMSLYFPYDPANPFENEYRGILQRRLITISTDPNAVKFLRETDCDWWIHTRELYTDIKLYLSEYLRFGLFETVTYHALMKWNQGCSGFPYVIKIGFTNMKKKMTYVYGEPLEPHSVFLFTTINTPLTLLFPDLRTDHVHYIRVAAHCTLAQMWQVVETDCMLARVTFGKDEGWLKSATLNASEPQRLPSGYSDVSLLTIWSDPNIRRNFTRDSCSLTLQVSAYRRLSFHTDVYRAMGDLQRVSQI